MTIRDLLTAYLLADSAITALVGTRIYPDEIPQKVVYPVIKIQQIDVIRPGKLNGAATRAVARIQLDAYAAPTSGISTRALADDVARAIRLRLAAKVLTLQDTTTSPPTPVFTQISEPDETSRPTPEVGGTLSEAGMDFLVSYSTHGGQY